MDRLIVETEKKMKQETKIEKKESLFPDLKIETNTFHKTEYLNSLDKLTIADIKRKEEEKRDEEFKIEKKVLLENQYQTNTVKQAQLKQEESQKIIEKPNYDLIEQPKKFVKLKTNAEEKKKSKKKVAGIILACALGAGAIVCVSNAVIIDNMNSHLLQIDEQYNINLLKYLKNLTDLDSTKKSMEIIETYPEETLPAGQNSQKSNWFDKICNFIGGIFGG